MISHVVCGRTADDLSYWFVDSAAMDVPLRRACARPLLQEIATAIHVSIRGANRGLGRAPSLAVVGEAGESIAALLDGDQSIFGIPLVCLASVTGHVPVGIIGEALARCCLAELVCVRAHIPAGVCGLDCDLARTRGHRHRTRELARRAHRRRLAAHCHCGRLAHRPAEQQRPAGLLAHQPVHVVVAGPRDSVVDLLGGAIAGGVVGIAVPSQDRRRRVGRPVGRHSELVDAVVAEIVRVGRTRVRLLGPGLDAPDHVVGIGEAVQRRRVRLLVVDLLQPQVLGHGVIGVARRLPVGIRHRLHPA